MRRSASSAENPHIPRPPRPPALLTAAARAGVLSQPIGAWRMGHLRLSLSVKAFLDHMDSPPDINRALVREVPVAGPPTQHPITAYQTPVGSPVPAQGDPQLALRDIGCWLLARFNCSPQRKNTSESEGKHRRFERAALAVASRTLV